MRADQDGIYAQFPGTRERLVCVAFVFERAKLYARFEVSLDARSSQLRLQCLRIGRRFEYADLDQIAFAGNRRGRLRQAGFRGCLRRRGRRDGRPRRGSKRFVVHDFRRRRRSAGGLFRPDWRGLGFRGRRRDESLRGFVRRHGAGRAIAIPVHGRQPADGESDKYRRYNQSSRSG